MVRFSGSTTPHHTFLFSFLSPPDTPPPPSPPPCPPSLSPNACLLLRQKQSRQLVSDRLLSSSPPLASFSQPDQGSPRPDSVSQFGFKTLFYQVFEEVSAEEDAGAESDERKWAAWRNQEKKKKKKLKVRVRVGNASAKRLLSGALAGAVSRTAVAPLETIRTHLMVGSSGGRSVREVFDHIMHTEGWRGLFRGNGVNVIRVAPSKAIELFAYDTIKKVLDKTSFVPSHIPVPTSSIAGAAAGICSTICTYPLELLKTRLTIQQGTYRNLLDALVKICQDEGPKELYRGLTPSLIGVIPYAATNYFAYDFLRKTYKRITKQEEIGNLTTLLIGSAAGAFAAASTFPLEVARKHMQVGAISGRPAYDNLFHALSSILEQQGPAGLYRGLSASCIKLIPAAGISFMCYEACKRILIEDDTQ